MNCADCQYGEEVETDKTIIICARNKKKKVTHTSQYICGNYKPKEVSQ